MLSSIAGLPNLLLAAEKAAKGKRDKTSTAQFLVGLESELFRLHDELLRHTWRPGGYRTFKIYDPKERTISAAPFADRVVHHALCNVIEPVFEKTFIHDSYANRKGKGTHKAIERYQQFARRFPFVLKCDIRKFFPSLDHTVLKQELHRCLHDPGTRRLCDTILDGSNPQEEHIAYFPGDDLFAPYTRRRGLPIGNLTSQFWANVYLNRFDHFVKESLRVKGYIRYVDDFVLFADTKAQLHTWKSEVERFLAGLRLLLHPAKTRIYRVDDGVPFLGFRVWPYHRFVQKPKTRRYRRFLKGKIRKYLAGEILPDNLEAAINAWCGHIRFGQSRRAEKRVIRMLQEAGINVLQHPNGSWRVLETPRKPSQSHQKHTAP